VGHEGAQRLIDYAAKHAIPITATAEKPYSMDRNLFHISYEGGILEDPWREPDEAMFLLTTRPRRRRISRVRRGRLRARRAGRRGRQSPGPGRAARRKLNALAASTASVASTSSRTATSA
jgi:hypothetical protein